MYNTIILLKGTETLSKREFEKLEKGNTIWGRDQSPEELKRWSIEQKQEAKNELADLCCEYHKRSEEVDITEYALAYCQCDEAGELICGSDYDLAEDEVKPSIQTKLADAAKQMQARNNGEVKICDVDER